MTVCFNVSGLGGFPPGQDGGTRAPVLIKHSASSAAFLTRLPKRLRLLGHLDIATRKHHRSNSAFRL